MVSLSFDSGGVAGMGLRSRVEGKMACSVIIRLCDDRADWEYANVEVDVLVDRRSDVTLAEIEEQARVDAITKLRAALELLEGQTLVELRQRERDQDTIRDRIRDQQFQESLGRAISTK